MTRARDLLLAAAIAMTGLAAVAAVAPPLGAAGWLTGFVLWSQIPVGSLVLMMIHRLTGGRWGEVLHPVFASAARLVPLLAVLAVPALAAIPLLWSHHAGSVRPDVISYYLNTPLLVGRSLIALTGWSALAFLLPRITGARGRLLAAVGLVLHAVLVSVVSIDWVLSIEPPFVSSSFGIGTAITQLIAALAWAVLWAPRAVDGGVTGDIGGLLLALVLAITYVDFMAFLVMWYSDQPARMSWFLERDRFPWPLLAGGAFVFASAAPILALLLASVRNRIGALRAVAISSLAGVALRYAYLIVPPFGGRALASAALAIIAIGLLFVVVGRPLSSAAMPGRALRGP
ncbi:MAG: hypothetical protein J2P53_06150 [Bradyrhizobiaceae bacterium]|nr:hypothetical protein [Bradyrhizobiaceae bacterium]